MTRDGLMSLPASGWLRDQEVEAGLAYRLWGEQAGNRADKISLEPSQRFKLVASNLRAMEFALLFARDPD